MSRGQEARGFAVSVTELLRHPGSQRPVSVSGPAESLVLSTAGVADGEVVSLDGVLEATADGSVTVTGAVRARWRGECRRCLREVEGELLTPVREVYAVSPASEDVYRFDGERLDLEPLVRDAVLLALPLAPLCEETCQGPDPADHPVVLEEEESATDKSDPRWSALSELRWD